MDDRSMSRILDRQSSIELEPRTLNLNQIDFAREAALYVLNTTSTEEAIGIFTQGLVPVVRCAGNDSECRLMDGGDEEEDWDDWDDEDPTMRDIFSAPF